MAQLTKEYFDKSLGNTNKTLNRVAKTLDNTNATLNRTIALLTHVIEDVGVLKGDMKEVKSTVNDHTVSLDKILKNSTRYCHYPT